MNAPDNPYRPPYARVADVANPAAGTPRPRVVSLVLWLLWANIAIEILDKILDVREAWPAISIAVVPSAITTIMVGVLCWLIFMIGRRRNWARITYAVLFAFGMIFHLVSWRNTLESPPRELIAIVLQSVLQLSAMILVFLPAPNAWFRSRSARP
jgi:hypothetical protein